MRTMFYNCAWIGQCNYVYECRGDEHKLTVEKIQTKATVDAEKKNLYATTYELRAVEKCQFCTISVTFVLLDALSLSPWLFSLKSLPLSFPRAPCFSTFLHRARGCRCREALFVSQKPLKHKIFNRILGCLVRFSWCEKSDNGCRMRSSLRCLLISIFVHFLSLNTRSTLPTHWHRSKRNLFRLTVVCAACGMQVWMRALRCESAHIVIDRSKDKKTSYCKKNKINRIRPQ